MLIANGIIIKEGSMYNHQFQMEMQDNQRICKIC